METLRTNKHIRVLMITSVWPSDSQPGLAPFLVEQVHSLRRNGIDVHMFPFWGNQDPVRYAMYWLKLHAECMFSQYDIIHAQFGQSGLIALPAKTPVVITFHGSDLQGWIGENGSYSLAGKVMQKASKWVAQYANQVIVVSEHLSRYLPAGLAFNVIPCGIDLSLFHPIPRKEARRQLNLPLDKNLVLFVGDPANPIKRYALAKQACDLIQREIDSKLIVVTDIPHNVMPIYMSACDVLIVTSKHEGSPTVIKEALACNLPIVSTDVGDVRERIGQLPGCEVCSSDDPQTIAAALDRVLSNTPVFDGRKVVENLELSVISQRIIQVYLRILEGRRNGAQ
jgi:teichuronic acid biosynthesis glycosyltransferase TuaC